MPLMLLNPDNAPGPVEPFLKSAWLNEVGIALGLLRQEPLNAAARAYVEAMDQAFAEYGEAGVKTQLAYIISNIRATTPRLKQLKQDLLMLSRGKMPTTPGAVQALPRSGMPARGRRPSTRPFEGTAERAITIVPEGGEVAVERTRGRLVKLKGLPQLFLHQLGRRFVISDPVTGAQVVASHTVRGAYNRLRKLVARYGGPAGFVAELKPRQEIFLTRHSHNPCGSRQGNPDTGGWQEHLTFYRREDALKLSGEIRKKHPGVQTMVRRRVIGRPGDDGYQVYWRVYTRIRAHNIARRDPSKRGKRGGIALYLKGGQGMVATGTYDTGVNMPPFQFVEAYGRKGGLALIAYGAYNAFGLIGPEKGGVALVNEAAHDVVGTLDVPYNPTRRLQILQDIYASRDWPEAAARWGFGMRYRPNPGAQYHRKKLKMAVESAANFRKHGADRPATFYEGKAQAEQEALVELTLPGWRRTVPLDKATAEKEFDNLKTMGFKSVKFSVQEDGSYVVYWRGRPSRRNPGAKWHLEHADEARELARSSKLARNKHYFQGKEAAHLESWGSSRFRKAGNPGSSYKVVSRLPCGLEIRKWMMPGFVPTFSVYDPHTRKDVPGFDTLGLARNYANLTASSRQSNPTPRKGYETFHQTQPDRERQVKVPRGWPKKLWMLGRLNVLILKDGRKVRGGTVAAGTGNRMYIINGSYTGRLGPRARAAQIEYVTPAASRRAGPVWFHPFDNPPPVRETAKGFLTLAGKGITLTSRGIVG